VSEAFLKNPLGLFDIKGRTAVATGTSGAFGALAAKVMAGAGANVVLAASKVDELKRPMYQCDGQSYDRPCAAIDQNAGAMMREDRQSQCFSARKYRLHSDGDTPYCS